MRTGTFTLESYLEKLNESANSKDGFLPPSQKDGMIVPEGPSKKAYDWLKKEYDKSQTEVKVEMKMGGTHFEPSMEFQTNPGDKTTKGFKSGLFGGIKTSDSEGGKSSDNVEEIDKKAGNDGKSDSGKGGFGDSTASKSTEKTEKKPEAKADKKAVSVDVRKEKKEGEEDKGEKDKKKEDDKR